MWGECWILTTRPHGTYTHADTIMKYKFCNKEEYLMLSLVRMLSVWRIHCQSLKKTTQFFIHKEYKCSIQNYAQNVPWTIPLIVTDVSAMLVAKMTYHDKEKPWICIPSQHTKLLRIPFLCLGVFCETLSTAWKITRKNWLISMSRTGL